MSVVEFVRAVVVVIVIIVAAPVAGYLYTYGRLLALRHFAARNHEEDR